jgi:vacuolar-type H+-ATPase subunit E/Vma4
MALEQLLMSLRQEADEEVGRLDAQARRHADEIVAQARERANRLAREREASAQDRAATAAALIVADARSQAQAQRRQARSDELATVLQDASAALARLRGTSRWEPVLAALLDEAWAVLPTAQQVHVDPADAEQVTALLDARGRPASVVADLRTCGGVVLRDAAGRLVDNTLETRLDGAWSRMRAVIAAGWQDAPDLPSTPAARDRT